MDDTESIPHEGEVVNNYAAILEEVGASVSVVGTLPIARANS